MKSNTNQIYIPISGTLKRRSSNSILKKMKSRHQEGATAKAFMAIMTLLPPL